MENGNTGADTNNQTAEDYFGIPTTVEEESTPTTDTQGNADSIDYQSEVNRLLKETTVGEDGKFIFPKGTEPWAKVAISNEKKFRDTQSGFTKVTQDNKVLTAELDVLKGKVAGYTGLSDEQNRELNELKATDPDAYFDKRTQYEAEASKQFDTELSDVREKTNTEIEMDRRTNYLEQFNVGRKVPITNELIKNDVPAKFYEQLTKGEVTFEGFLDNVSKFVDTPKVAGKKDEGTQVTNLSDVAGGDTPSSEKRFVNLEEEYSKVVF